ncbi:hypothetical protein LN042_16640 [Kitasatospora sp. RB6PN24]|uniref:hypothetical protein n=1 Tax=Kitasatospora humi TaxID=2893891 RepID=UPI001E38076F|nr:hypothetical protein [Kitasatospora humi]MCC9308690.1 hypothetical protein [Kitasatospora humi]
MAKQTRVARQNARWEAFKAGRVRARREELDEVISPWLRPPERERGATEVTVDVFAPHRVPRRLRATKPAPPGGWRRGPTERLDRVVIAVLEPVSAVLRFFRKFPHGLPFRGGWSSQAGRFLIMVRTGPSTHRYHENNEAVLVFTDRRVLVLHPGSGERLGELALDQLVVGAPKERPWRQPGRVDIRFTDGSLLAVECRHFVNDVLRSLLAGRA